MTVTPFRYQLSPEARRTIQPQETREGTNVELDSEIIEIETPGLLIKCMSDVRAKPIEWLWHNRIALGKVTVLAGDGGLGKSTILCDLTARPTTGIRWPDGAHNEHTGNVIILAAEDAADDTLKPRLAAAGADMARVFVVPAVREERGSLRSFNLQADLLQLEAKIKEIGDVRLVIIDPISSYLGKVDSHKNAEVRSVLEPLGQVATRTGCAFICNNHFSKGNGGANSRIIGSVAFVNQARAAFIVTPDAEDATRRLFLPSKMNIAAMGEGLAYRIGGFLAQVDGLEIPTSQICWETAPVTTTADAALAALSDSGGDKSALDEACEFLELALAAGRRPNTEIKDAAKAHMISTATLRRAKDRLPIKVIRDGFGLGSSVWWELDHRCSNAPIDAQASYVSTYGENEHVWRGEALPVTELDPADFSAADWERQDEAELNDVGEKKAP